MKKNTKIIILVLAAAVFFICVNRFLPTFSGTFLLSDDYDWNDISYEVVQGDSNKFSVSLADSQTVKATYDGDLDFCAIITLSDDSGNSKKYEMRIYSDFDVIRDTSTTVSEFNPLD